MATVTTPIAVQTRESTWAVHPVLNHTMQTDGDCMICLAMCTCGLRIAGMAITETHPKMVQLGLQKTAVIVIVACIVAVRGTTDRNTFALQIAEGASTMLQRTKWDFALPGHYDTLIFVL